MKLSDILVQLYSVGRYHGNAFVKEHLGEIFSFSLKKMAFFSLKTYSYRFLVQIGNQRLKIDLCAKFQPDWTKDKGT